MPTKRRDQSRVDLRRAEALGLRRAGLSYRQIGERMGLSLGRAYSLVSEALSQIIHEEATALRDLEASRLDTMQAAIWSRAVTGDLRAIDTALRISARRSRLLGLDLADSGAAIPADEVETLARVYVEAAVDAAPYLSAARFVFALTSWARASAREELLGSLLGTAPDAAQESIGRQYALASKQAADGREALGLAPTSAAQIASLVRQAGPTILNPSEQREIES